MRRTYPRGAVAAVLAILCTAGTARADEPIAVRLLYTRGPGAEVCPRASFLMSSVAGLLGTSPWSDDAPRNLVVAVQALSAGGHAVRIELRGAQGQVAGVRELRSSQPDCKELAETMALAIAIAIDPLSAVRLGAAATTSSQPVRKEGQSRDREPAPYLDGRRPPAPPTPTPLRKKSGGSIVVRSLEVGVSGLFSVGAAPAVAGALALHGGYRWPRFSVSLEGRFDFPASVDVLGGVVDSSLILGSARGCFHHGWLYGCGFFAGGALRASGGAVDREAKVTLPFVALGGRLGADLPVIAALSFRLHADLLAPLTRITLREADTDEELWTTPPVSAAFGLSAVGHFL